MSTFYVVPPRRILANRFAKYLKSVFPGLEWEAEPDLADTLEELAEARNDVFVVYRDELPAVTDLNSVLTEFYGAEENDMIVEVTGDNADPTDDTRLWRIAA